MSNNDILWLCVLIVPIVVIMLLKLLFFIIDFMKELRYIDCEIARTHGSERRHWIHKRKRLLRSLWSFKKHKKK